MSFFKSETAIAYFEYYLKWLDLTAISIDYENGVLTAEVLEVPDEDYFSLCFETNDGNFMVELNTVDLFNDEITQGFFTGYKMRWCIECRDLKQKLLYKFYVYTQDEAREFMPLNFNYFPIF